MRVIQIKSANRNMGKYEKYLLGIYRNLALRQGGVFPHNSASVASRLAKQATLLS